VAKQVPAGHAGGTGAYTAEGSRFRRLRPRDPADGRETALNGAQAS